MKKLLLLFCFALLVGQSYAQRYELDNSYTTGTGFDGEVNAMVLDSNGKLVVGGDFTEYNGTTRNYLARLNADGTVDTGFNPGTSLTNTVYDITVHSDNTITVATVGGVKRFDNTGSEIAGPTFVPDAADYIINVVAAESSGLAVIIAGSFTDVGGTTAKGIARLNADGTIDATFATKVGTGFNVSGSFGSKEITSIEITTTGKILLGGDFTSFNGVTRNHIALLNSDGTLDTSFDPGITLIFDPSTYSVAMQADGKVLAGSYSTTQGTARFVRFSATGTEEFSSYIFNSEGDTSFPIFDIETQGTDNILLVTHGAGGLFSIDYTTGTVNDINAGHGTGTGIIRDLVLNLDGSIILGGTFIQYNGILANRIVKVATCGVSIEMQPDNVIACETTDASFTVTAAGTGTLSYQWQLNDIPFANGIYTDIADDATYAGATTATLSITNASMGMNGYYYRCVITDDNCSSTSEKVILTVTGYQAITDNPVDQGSCVGDNVMFWINFSGPGGGFQWQEDTGTGVFSDIANGGVYSGATTATLSIIGTTVNMNGYKYRLKSTKCDPAGILSTEATLSVNDIPVISQNPSAVELCASGDASFSVAATSGGTITYQWQYYTGSSNYFNLNDGGVYSGVNSNTLQLTGVDNSLAEIVDLGSGPRAYFRCIVTSNNCSVNTSLTTLEIYSLPIITSQPQDKVACFQSFGTTGSFRVITSETYTVYQWQVDTGTGIFVDLEDDVIYQGSNQSILTITDPTMDFSGYKYRCVVGSCSPSVISDVATLTLVEWPDISIRGGANCEGSDAILSIYDIFTGGSLTDSNLTYQWQIKENGSFVDIVDDVVYSGSNADVLTISGVSLNMSGVSYRCIVNNGTCGLYPQKTLRVYAQPTLSSSTTASALTVCPGSPTWLRVTPSSSVSIGVSQTFNFQWQTDNGTGVFTDLSDDIYFSGTNSYTLVIDSAVYAFNGFQFRCVIRGCTTENASDPETLTVLPLPKITESPQSQEVCPNRSVKLTAAATGTNVRYSWWRDTGDGDFQRVRSAKASPDYYITVDESFNGYKYKCIATEYGCTEGVETLEATLSIVQPIQITEQPQPQIVCDNTEVTFTTTATGSDFTYSWMVDTGNGSFGNVSLDSATPEYTFTSAISMNGYKYKCIIKAKNCNTTAESEVVVLTVTQTEISTTQDIVNVCAGESAAFTAEAIGVGDINYQWSIDGTDLANDDNYSGVNSQTLTVSGATTPITNLLLTVSSDCGSTLLPFTLNVYGIERPEITPDFGNPNNPQLQVSTAFVLGVDNFEWFLDGSSYQNSGSTTSITIDQAGSYTVIATKNDCQYPESEAFVIVVTGFENNLSINSVSLYPNPVRNKLTLDLGSSFNLEKGAQIIVTNMSGQEVFNRNYNSLYNRRTQIDMSGYESGIYLVRVVGGGKMVQYKIRKQ